LHANQKIITQQWIMIREAHGIMDAKKYGSKFLENHYGDLLYDDGVAKKSSAINLTDSRSLDYSVELLGDNASLSDADEGDGESVSLALTKSLLNWTILNSTDHLFQFDK
jgi:hypothetical protein